MATFRRLGLITLIIGWFSRSFSMFALPFIDVLERPQLDVLSYYGISNKLNDFNVLASELNKIMYYPNIYNYRVLAVVLNAIIVGMFVIAIIGIIKPRSRIVRSVAMYNLFSMIIMSIVMVRVNNLYEVRVFANPANNVFFLIGLTIVFSSSFSVTTVINEDVKKEGFSL